MAVWCACPIASSLTNGLGLYDGLSASFGRFVMWGLPYLLGRPTSPASNTSVSWRSGSWWGG